MKIMVATDGSEAAIEAARRALPLLREGAEILLVTVIQDYEDPMEIAGGFEGPLLTPEEAEADFQKQALAGQAVLEHSRQALGQEVEIRLMPTQSDPGHAIVEMAGEIHADLLVLGSEEKGFFERLLTGSVSDFVVRHAPCPVLVVPHRGAAVSG